MIIKDVNVRPDGAYAIRLARRVHSPALGMDLLPRQGTEHGVRGAVVTEIAEANGADVIASIREVEL